PDGHAQPERNPPGRGRHPAGRRARRARPEHGRKSPQIAEMNLEKLHFPGISAILPVACRRSSRPPASFRDQAILTKGRTGLFDVGDKVVYPHHGAGTVIKKEKREILGQTREYLTIQILHNDMTVNVPVENAEKVGLRGVIEEDLVTVVVKALTAGESEMPKNWNRRFKHNRDKMKTGDIFELAEVVKNLSLRDHEKGLSTGEKQMFVKAKKILASELMYAKGVDEEAAAEWLDEVLAGVGEKPAAKKKSKAKAAAAA
ncbi:MAG TPA: CarD family transcriptional regulator, partial [Gaiellaceae bacterium]|nr:CarD family transcriptional regulator [Gaiellaceae bacterium]